MTDTTKQALEKLFGEVPTARLLQTVHRLQHEGFYETSATEDLEHDFILHLLRAKHYHQTHQKTNLHAYLIRTIETYAITLRKAAHKASLLLHECDLPATPEEQEPDESFLEPHLHSEAHSTTNPAHLAQLRLDCETLLGHLPPAYRPVLRDIFAGISPTTACRNHGFIPDTFRRHIAPKLKPYLYEYRRTR